MIFSTFFYPENMNKHENLNRHFNPIIIMESHIASS